MNSFQSGKYRFKCPCCGNIEIHHLDSVTPVWECFQCSLRQNKRESVYMLNAGKVIDTRLLLLEGLEY